MLATIAAERAGPLQFVVVVVFFNIYLSTIKGLYNMKKGGGGGVSLWKGKSLIYAIISSIFYDLERKKEERKKKRLFISSIPGLTTTQQ